MTTPTALILPFPTPELRRAPGFGSVSALGWVFLGCSMFWLGVIVVVAALVG